MKNFKRVISAVIALALSASTLVAVSAAKFTDVDNTNSYAKAIESLAALDIVSGYEDGSFNPDGDITRAEAARMIVSALNMNADAAASAGDTQFADVNENAAWAKGYVNVGVAQGYIHGYDETSFGPQDKVTYAQLCVMLTTITGYSDYAATNGGYPQGYMNMASTAGINKGVALAAETPLKRGQVAQMVYNGVTAPMLDVSVYKFDGNEYSKMDGISTRVRKSLITEKFNAVEAKVLVNRLTGVNKVELSRTDDLYYANSAGYSNFNFSDVIVDNDIDLTNYVKQEIKGIFKLDENNKTHLIYAEGTTGVTTKEVAAASYYKASTATGESWIKFGTQKENFEPAVALYVNGSLYTAGSNATLPGDVATAGFAILDTLPAGTPDGDTVLTDYLMNATGTIKLAKVPYAQTISGETSMVTPANYNTIFIDAYQIAQVRSVEYLSGKTTVYFALLGSNNISSYESIAVTDNEISNGSIKVKVTLNGEEIELKDLQKDDIIAIKTNISGTRITALNNDDVSILVSRETVAGKVTAVEVDDNDNKFTIDGTDYASVDKANIRLALNTQYNVVNLDPFGRIAAFSEEDVEESHTYAIVAKIDGEEVTLVLADGTKKTYEVKDNTVYSNARNNASTPVAGLWASDTIDVATTIVLAANQHPNDDANHSLNSVVEYTLKNGKITSLIYQVPTYINTNVSTTGEYKSEVSRIGSIGINSATNIINVEDASYKKYTGWSVSQLSNSEKYAGMAYGKVRGTTVFSLVLLSQAGFTFGASSRFAVIDATEWSEGLDSDGDAVNQLKVLVNGEKSTLNFGRTVDVAGTPVTVTAGTTLSGTVGTRGTAFFYTLDSDGNVSSMYPITLANIATRGAVTFARAFGGTANIDGYKWQEVYGTSTESQLINGTKDYRLVQGIVVGVSSNTVKMIDIPTTADQAVDITQYEALRLADDCKVYTYNGKADVETKDRLNATGVLLASDFSDWKITVDPEATSEATVGLDLNNDGDSADTILAQYGTGDLSKVAWGFIPSAAAGNPNATQFIEAQLKAHGIKTTLASTLTGKKASQKAQYALALEIDGEVVEIYEIIQ